MSRFTYNFSNLCGTVYRQGNLVFSPDGDSLYSAVGNRVAAFDLVRSRTFTFPFEARRNISALALSPEGTILIAIDDEGHLLLANVAKRAVVAHLNLKARVADVKFSPDGKWVAFAVGRFVQVWATPALERSFTPFALHKTLGGHGEDVLCIDWSADSLFIASGGRDLSVIVHSVHKLPLYTPPVLSGHRSSIKAVFFDASGGTIYAVSREGALSVWELEQRPDVDMKAVAAAKAESVASRGHSCGEDKIGYWWRLSARHYFDKDHARVSTASFHAASRLLVVGFATGVFALYEVPDLNEVHTLSISEGRVDTAAISPGGEWLAFGCAQLGQLLVWEWQAESYVLKQQGHFFAEINCLAYSPGGAMIATGGGDSKVKLWSPASGFCFVTFTEHAAPVTAVAFVPHGRAVLSASLDGTVRAFDLLRYRNFQTLVSPTPAQFICVCVDPSGEVVVAGSRDTLLIYVWNLQTAQLLEALSGHEAPVSCLAFGVGAGGVGSFLASGSWDKTVRVWDFVSSNAAIDVLQHGADVLDVAFRPDGEMLAAATLDGQIALWDAREAQQVGSIDGRADVLGGRSSLSKVSAKNAAGGKCFRSVCYSADGSCLIAGGSSKFVCLYDVSERMLLRKFVLSHNGALDGVRLDLNSSKLTDAGVEEDLLLDDASDDPSTPAAPRALGRRSERISRLAVRCACVRFSPDGRSWAAASTEGLLIYSQDEERRFDPTDLEVTTTPSSVAAAISSCDFGRALPMALCLNEPGLIRAAWQRVPPPQIQLVAQSVPLSYLERLLRFLAVELDRSRHVHALLLWVQQLLIAHGAWLRDRTATYEVPLRALLKGARARYDELSHMCNGNVYALDFLDDALSRVPANDDMQT
uniref:Small-subunit processome Utp12 domain-containing protein n=1 Tax=Coccolithus braarudii TaxID=221442 RepID=A0A7S0Q3Z6_9EUKA|mmetsp:Transcript_45430/g.96688  ORF Transcript_45430/g.96688 Transcript_45430/m.96688 type:complete len:870 (+) Transcript_45430:44-2653(+)